MHAVLKIVTLLLIIIVIINSCTATLNELEMEKYHLEEFMAPTALQYCPAYETASHIK